MYRSKIQRCNSAQNEINRNLQATTSLPQSKSRSQPINFMLEKYFRSTASYRTESSQDSLTHEQVPDISSSADLFDNDENTIAELNNRFFDVITSPSPNPNRINSEPMEIIDLIDIPSTKSNTIKSEPRELWLSTSLSSIVVEKKEKKRRRRESRAELSKIIENDSFHSASSQISFHSNKEQNNKDNSFSIISVSEPTLVYSEQVASTILEETTVREVSGIWSEVALEKAETDKKYSNKIKSKPLAKETTTKVRQTEKKRTNASYPCSKSKVKSNPGSPQNNGNKETVMKSKEKSDPGSLKIDWNIETVKKSKKMSNSGLSKNSWNIDTVKKSKGKSKTPPFPKNGKTRNMVGNMVSIVEEDERDTPETRPESKRKLRKPASPFVEGGRIPQNDDMPLSQNLLEFLDKRADHEAKRILRKRPVGRQKPNKKENKIKVDGSKNSLASKNSKIEKKKHKPGKSSMPLTEKKKIAGTSKRRELSLPISDEKISKYN